MLRWVASSRRKLRTGSASVTAHARVFDIRNALVRAPTPDLQAEPTEPAPDRASHDRAHNAFSFATVVAQARAQCTALGRGHGSGAGSQLPPAAGHPSGHRALAPIRSRIPALAPLFRLARSMLLAIKFMYRCCATPSRTFLLQRRSPAGLMGTLRHSGQRYCIIFLYSG